MVTFHYILHIQFNLNFNIAIDHVISRDDVNACYVSKTALNARTHIYSDVHRRWKEKTKKQKNYCLLMQPAGCESDRVRGVGAGVCFIV